MMTSLPASLLLFAPQQQDFYYRHHKETSQDPETPAHARQDFLLAVIDSALKTLGAYEEEEDNDEDDTQQQPNILVPQ